MSYTYLLEREEESSVASFSDIPLSVLSRLNLTAEKFYSKGSGMESSQSSQFGRMSPPSTELRGEEKSMSSAEDFLAKTFQSQTQKAEDWMVNEADYGVKCGELLAKYDHASSLWKTAQCLLFEEGLESLRILPNWGMTADGELWEVATPTVLCEETECGYLPATVASDGKHHGKEKWISNSRAKRKATGKSAPTEKITYAYYECGIPTKYFPEISEDVMHWPIGWTDLLPLEMGKMQLWLQQHGEFLEVGNEVA